MRGKILTGSVGAFVCLVMAVRCAGDPGQKIFDVTEYGARADGASDCSAAVQAAIDAAGESGGGRILFPPAKKPYLITDSVLLDANNLHLKGTGARVLLKDGAATGRTDAANLLHIILIRGRADAPIENVSIEGLAIDANYWAQTGNVASWQESARRAGTTRGVMVNHARRVFVKDVTIDRSFAGMTFGLGSHDCEAVNVKVTRFHHDAFGVTPGRVTAGASGITFRACVAADAPDGRNGGLPGGRIKGWEIEEGAQDVRLVGCEVRDTDANGFFVRPHGGRNKFETRNVELIGCRVERAGDAAFMVKGLSNLQTTRDIRLIDCSTDTGCLQIMMNPDNVTVRGGTFGRMTIGYYKDFDDDHHLPDGPWQELRDRLPTRSVTVEDVTVSGDVRINAGAGNDGGSAYAPDVRLTKVTVKGDLYIVGPPSAVTMDRCMIGGTTRAFSPEAYFQPLRASRVELEPESGRVGRCAPPPSVDGRGNDGCWKAVEPLEIRHNPEKTRRGIGGHSFVRICYDDRAVYVLIECLESDMKKIRTAAKGRDADLWFDDCVEIFFHRQKDPDGYFHQWMISAAGVIYDGDQATGEKWNGSAKVAVKKRRDRYVVETAIPWTDLGGPPAEGEEILANFVRNRATDGTRWIWSWRRDATVVFGDTGKMGTLVLE